jgi:prepilin-type N-terminal cleavage/methylation domain-containing protein
MNKLLKPFRARPKAFTLIELLVAVAILGVIVGGLTLTISQVISVNASSMSRETVIKEVESAVQYISRDAQQAQRATFPVGSFVNLAWTSWNSDVYNVLYKFDGTDLTRTYTKNGANATTNTVARNIDTSPGMTACSWSGNVLNLKITASTGGFKPASETREVQVMARFGK